MIINLLHPYLCKNNTDLQWCLKRDRSFISIIGEKLVIVCVVHNNISKWRQQKTNWAWSNGSRKTKKGTLSKLSETWYIRMYYSIVKYMDYGWHDRQFWDYWAASAFFFLNYKCCIYWINSSGCFVLMSRFQYWDVKQFFWCLGLISVKIKWAFIFVYIFSKQCYILKRTSNSIRCLYLLYC